MANICAGSAAHCIEVLNHTIIHKIIYSLSSEEYRVRKEACYIIEHMLDKNNDVITNALLDLEVGSLIIKILNEIDDELFLEIALICLKNLLSIGRF